MGPKSHLKGEEINNLAAGITTQSVRLPALREIKGVTRTLRVLRVFRDPQGFEEARQRQAGAGVLSEGALRAGG